MTGVELCIHQLPLLLDWINISSRVDLGANVSQCSSLHQPRLLHRSAKLMKIYQAVDLLERSSEALSNAPSFNASSMFTISNSSEYS